MSKGLVERIIDADKSDRSVSVILLIDRFFEQGLSATARIWDLYARSLTGVGRYSDALIALEEAETLATKDARPWLIAQKGRLERRRGNLARAKNYWLSAHELKPNEATFLIFAASTEFQLGHLQEAEGLARRATDCTEGYVDEAWFNLGGYLAAQERYQEAVECYAKAIEIDPAYELALSRQAEILEFYPHL